MKSELELGRQGRDLNCVDECSCYEEQGPAPNLLRVEGQLEAMIPLPGGWAGFLGVRAHPILAPLRGTGNERRAGHQQEGERQCDSKLVAMEQLRRRSRRRGGNKSVPGRLY